MQKTETVKKHTGNTFFKKLVLISKTQSKCAICLTKIDDKYGLQSELKIYL